MRCVWVWTIGPDLCEQVRVRFDLDPTRATVNLGHATSGDYAAGTEIQSIAKARVSRACVRQVGSEPFFQPLAAAATALYHVHLETQKFHKQTFDTCMHGMGFGHCICQLMHGLHGLHGASARRSLRLPCLEKGQVVVVAVCEFAGVLKGEWQVRGWKGSPG
jgi:hypothetical protein